MVVASRWGKTSSILIWVLALMVLWQLCAMFLVDVMHMQYAAAKLPLLNKVFVAMYNDKSTLLSQCGVTFMNSMTGFVLGAVVGTGIAVLMNMWRFMENIIMPYAIASQMIPVIGLAPIVFGILHNASLSRIVISAYVTFFPVSINVLRGLRSVSPTQVELMRIYAASPWQLFVRAKWKSAMPSLFTGLKLSAPLAVTGAILVELMGAPNGVGVLMLNSIYYGSTEIYLFWATAIACVCIGLLSFLMIVGLERLLTPWQPEFRKGSR